MHLSCSSSLFGNPDPHPQGSKPITFQDSTLTHTHKRKSEPQGYFTLREQLARFQSWYRLISLLPRHPEQSDLFYLCQKKKLSATISMEIVSILHHQLILTCDVERNTQSSFTHAHGVPQSSVVGPLCFSLYTGSLDDVEVFHTNPILM